MGLVDTSRLNSSSPADDIDIIASNQGMKMIIAKRPDKLQHVINAIADGYHLHFISNGDWSMHDFFNALLPIYKPAELWFSTYAIREYSVRQIINAKDEGALTAVNLLLDYRAKVLAPEVYQLAANIVNQVKLTSVHAKIMVLKNADKCITLVGSQNWTDNPRMEVGMISTERSLGDFYINVLQKALDNGDVFE